MSVEEQISQLIDKYEGLDALDRLLKRKRIPKKQRYAKNSRGGTKNG